MSESQWLDEQDIAELDELLSALQNPDALRLDGAQGVLAAVAISPERIESEIWLPVILGSEPTLEATEQAQRLLELLVRLKSAVDYGIAHYSFEPIFAELVDESDDSHVAVSGWCDGFSLGIDLLAEQWEAQMLIDDTLIELLSPIMALGVDDGAFSEMRHEHVAPLSDAEREDLMQQLPRVLSDVLHYWDDAERSAKPLSKSQLH
jgi:uncharacterized protein